MSAKNLLSFEAALARILAAARPLQGRQTLELAEANGRVLAEEIRAPIALPPFDNAAMDGYAMRAADALALGGLPIAQRIAAGQAAVPIVAGEAARIFTGAMLPPGADCVVMQEDCREEAGRVFVQKAARAGQHIRRAGEELAAQSLLLPKGKRLRAGDLGLLAASGIARIAVTRPPRVALLVTGSELVEPGQALRAGAIYNANQTLLRALLQSLGCEVLPLPVVADDFAATETALRRAAEQCDVILSSGGVSVGEEDHVKAAFQRLGTLDLWRIAIKPGKPLAFGRCHDAGAWFVGLPGNPVSAFVTFVMFVRPFLLRLSGMENVAPLRLGLPAAFDWPPGDKVESRHEFLRVKFNESGALELCGAQGAAWLSGVAFGDGLCENPPGQRIMRGQSVSFLPYADLLH